LKSVTSTLTAVLVDGHAKLRALDHRGEIGGLDLKMIFAPLLDLEQDRARLLQDGGREAVLLLGGDADDGVGGDEDRLFAARQKHASVLPGANHVTGFERGVRRQ
jgi:hypothetical protein